MYSAVQVPSETVNVTTSVPKLVPGVKVVKLVFVEENEPPRSDAQV